MSRSRLLRAAVLACALAAVAPGASAEVVRLKTGETIKGRVVAEKSREAFLVIEDYGSGALREIAWGALVERDRERWLEQLGMEDKKGLLISCDVVTYRVGTGTDQLHGIVVSDGDPVRVRAGGGREPVAIERSRIVSIEKGECEATEVYSPIELYEQKKAEVSPGDARGWWLLARYAEKVGAYEQAKEAYENVSTDAEFLYAEQARTKVAQLSALLKDKEALETIRDLKIKLSSNQFASVRKGLDGFFELHPQAGEGVKKSVETLKEQFKKAREKALARAAGDRFVKIVRGMIRTHVKDKEIKVNDVLGWAKRTLTEEAMAELAKSLQKMDPAVTPEEARTLWDARPKKDWKRASYGAGTFVVEPPKIKAPSGSGGGNRRSQGGPAVQIEIPKPPTRDGWWEKESIDKREEWVLAHYAETSGLFEVAPKKDRSPCDICTATGLIRRLLSGGGELVFLCTRCGGAQFDLTVKFR